MPVTKNSPRRSSYDLPRWIADPRHESIEAKLVRHINGKKLPKELVVSGPAGTGKTLPILRVLHVAARERPGLRILFLRATRVSLTESVLVTFEEEVLVSDGMERLAGGAGRAHRVSYDYPNGSTIVPAGLDRTPSRVLSTAWDIVYTNECIEIKEEVWETLASRMDRPGRQSLGWLIGDTNPGSPDHWLKKRCDSGRTALWETTHHANPAMHDGRDWTTAGLRYLARLGALTGVRRKRLLDGLWVQGEGIWFDTFDPEVHVTERAEYSPLHKTILAIDTGLRTGAVWFQVVDRDRQIEIHVFDDYFCDGAIEIGQKAYHKAAAILEKCKGRRIDRTVHDPAGMNPEDAGPAAIAEYERAGLRGLEPWPHFPVRDGLELIESFVGGGLDDPPPALFVHPRCKHLINAFGAYRRAKVGEVWLDKPLDPQHPYEEHMDGLRGGLVACFPDGRRPRPLLHYVSGRNLV